MTGKGFFLLINPNGSKWWRFHYRFEGKQKNLSMGVFPEVGLADAREKVDEARSLLAKGIDPPIERKKSKASTALENSFEATALKWIEVKANKWTERNAKDVLHTLQRDIFS